MAASPAEPEPSARSAPDPSTRALDYSRLYEYRFKDVDQHARQLVWNEIAQFLWKRMGQPARVLDPAGGRGEFVNAVPAAERWLIDVVDYPERATDPRVRIVIGDLFEIELPPAYFDGVFASNLLEHFHSPEEVSAFLDRMRETLAPGGVLALMGPNFKYCARDYFDCADHLLALTHVSVEELLFAAGYKVIEVVPRFLPFSFRSRLPASRAHAALSPDAGLVAAPGQAVPDPRDARVSGFRGSACGSGRAVAARRAFRAPESAGTIARLTKRESRATGVADQDASAVHGQADMSMSFSRDVVIVGGCGHVGLPLGLVLADAGLSVTLYDLDANAVDRVRAAKMPFWERDADEMLERLIATDLLDATIDPTVVSEAEHVVLVVGTPVDEHLNPDPKFVRLAIEGLLDQLRDGQHLILRSTVYPRVTAMVEKLLTAAGRDIDVSFCPERIAEGKALEELRSLPQIVSARTERAVQRADAFFARIAPSIVHLDVEEAELAKLFANTWRYIQFAAANQLFMIANDFGLDFARIRSALKQDYPRLAGMPGPGLAAGPCLLKDTMQLAAFNNNNFTLGHASMMINEGLPLYMVSKLEQEYDLSEMTVGILGMAFKAESDDTRSSLSYKLKRLLRFRAARVLCSDPYAQTDPDLWPVAEVLAESDLIVIATPHRQYADISVDVPVVDVWNLLGNGERV